MNANTTRRAGLAVMAALAMTTATVAAAETTKIAEIKQVGKTAVVYRGPDVDVALSYRYAEANPGLPWLFLDVGMTSNSTTVELPRTAIAVRAPDGEVIPLASQEAFGAAYNTLAANIAGANVASEPLTYFPPERVRRLKYFTIPGRGIAFSTEWLDTWHNSYGRLYFQVPGGVRPGRWALLIDLPENQVEIPFTISS